MKNIHRWFILHDTSNKLQHVHQRFPDVRRYDDPDDQRLEWLEVTFPEYMENLKKQATHARGFLTTETYEALLLTTYSTVACIRYLLRTENFPSVLTRKFSSDPTESLFGTLRRSLGCNDQLDARSAVSGLQKLLKTGIAAASENSNVLRSEEAGQNNRVVVARQQTPTISAKLPQEAVHVSERLKRTNVPASLPTLQLSATVYVGGYIARVVMEHTDCKDCCAVTTKALCNHPLQQFVRHQDRGGLLHPLDKLL
ncbi:hypothetical protein HPB50_005354 [Hyalomma asiaticum]|uniref:Uncharacterized protein n=1 Tax=Hyalomma asiaticum TaxID=266040 RepID=A0ACB7SEC6_HYAAI|nr:hypothetical protein HPB50_005354 [Hyalomma asiaticum]